MKSPEKAIETMIANLVEKTGKSLEEWIALAKKAKGGKHGEIVAHLKSDHGLGHGYANLVARRTLEGDAPAQKGSDALVDGQYTGARAGLRPIYEAVVAAARKLGADVEVVPKKTCVALRRELNFAIVQPASNTRVDLGLKLKGVPLGGRLEAWPNTMCTHRVRLASVADVDRELVQWMRQACDAARG